MNLLKRDDFDSQEELYDFVMENNKEFEVVCNALNSDN